MVLMDKIWDDVLAGPQPERGLGRFRKIKVKTNGEGEGSSSSSLERSLSMPSSPEAPATPTTPTTPPSPMAARKDNVWRSMVNPRSNQATKSMGSQVYDKPQPNSPTVYDWMYSGETRSKHHH